MLRINVWQWQVLFIIGVFQISTAYRISFTLMKCTYGERGSLTATCENVNDYSFFKTTSYRFDHLDETLQCINCSLKSVEPNTFDIAGNQIKHLILRNDNIDELQQRSFVGLVFLKDLDLSNNNIRLIHSGTFVGVKKIELVVLKNNSLTTLTRNQFSELINLDTLILSINKISGIEMGAFNGLKNLRVLNLNHNYISNVTAIFNELTSLQYLDLSENSISTLKGNEFDNLTALLELKFDKNKIKKLPAIQFMCMTSLEFLGLSYNSIETIETKAFQGLEMLETLDLGNNQIEDIPKQTFQSLYNLINMNLTGNKIKNFKTSRFAGLPKLRLLNLSHNEIKNIDTSGIFPLHDLHSLDLSYNNLTDLNYVALLHRMPRITYLALQNNYWPCDLEDEMDKIFGGENFKFILFDNKNGSIKCYDSLVRKMNKSDAVSVEKLSGNDLVKASTSQPLFMGFFMICISAAVLILSIGQYRIAKELRFNPLLRRRRTTSEVKLFQSDIQEDDNDFMK